MKRYIASFVSFEKKDILKTSTPTRSWQRWIFNKETKEWTLTLQTAQATKTFEKNLIRWCGENGIVLTIQ